MHPNLLLMEKYRYFFHNNLDLACFADLGGYFEELNESFTRVLGYSSDDLRDKQFFEFTHPDDIESTFKAMEEFVLVIIYFISSIVSERRIIRTGILSGVQ